MKNLLFQREFLETELFLAIPEEIIKQPRESKRLDYKRITIRSGEKNKTHILIFNKSIICKEAKIECCFKKIEQNIPILLRGFRCQKCGPHKDSS